MDIVYLIKTDSENDLSELRYSLRSLINLPHGRVFIVGEKPDWVANITHIPVEQTKTKSENVAMNIRAAVESDEISDEFIMMNDDFFIMKPQETLPTMHFGYMKDVIDQYAIRYPESTPYIDTMKKLYALLQRNGTAVPISYELHVPMVFSKSKIAQLYQYVPMPYYQFRSFYGNYYQLGGNAMDDVKLFVEPRHNAALYRENPMEYMRKQSFLSSTGGAFKRGIAGDFVRAAFPEKSEYEV